MDITKHRPKHIFQDNTAYFLTGRTYGNISHLAKKDAKKIFKDVLFEKIKKFNLDLKGWTILDSHYHLLNRGLKSATSRRNGIANFSSRLEKNGVANFSSRLEKNGIANFSSRFIPQFIKELHGATSFKIKKLPIIEILNEEQLMGRKRTPMEERIEKRLDDIIRQWSSELQFAINNENRRLKSATSSENEIAHFSARLSPPQKEQVELAIKRKDFELAKTLLITFNRGLKSRTKVRYSFDIPFWYQYTDHVIRSERDYYMHLNYIHQNCVKHGLVKNMWEYPFSSIHEYDKALIQDSFTKYPIIDFTPEIAD